MASRVELCDVLTEYGLTRNELSIPCPAKVCNIIAMKLDRWELLASSLGLAEEDCTAIREDYNTNYAVQRSVSLNTWRKQFGSKATYLMLAEGLEKIKRLDLVGELCVLYKDTVASQDTDNETALTIGPKGNVEEIISRFELQFEDLAFTTFQEVREGNKVSLEQFRFTLTLFPLKVKNNHFTFLEESIPKLMKASNLQEIFMHLNLYWNCFNYTLLQEIVNRYGSENLKKQMKSYDSNMQQFLQKTTVADFIPYCKGLRRFEKVPEGFIEVKDVIDKPITEITLLELEELRLRHTSSCQLPIFALILFDIQKGSLEVTWLVATELQKQLKEALRRELSGQLEKETQQIVSISVGGECIKRNQPTAKAPKRKEQSETCEDMIDAPQPKKTKKLSSSYFSPNTRTLCSICKRSIKLTTSGNLRTHGPRNKRCHGSPITSISTPKRKERSETYEDMIDAPPPKKPKKPSSSGFSPRKVYTDILNETTRKEVIKLFESDLTLDIVVIGEAGIGKSTLVNGIIGKEAAPTGDFSRYGITAKTTSYIGNVGSVKICLWDTPGLFDPSHNTVRVMADIKHLINTADLVYLCIDMIPARFLEDAKAIKIIKKLPTMSSDIWDKTVIILTQANVVVSKFSHKYDKEKVEDEYKDKLSKWKEYIRELLPPTNQIPIIPAGYRLPRIIESDEELWISLLWRETCKVIKKPEAQAAFIKASIPRFQNEVKEDRIKEKKLYEQPIQEPAISDRISSFIQGSAAAAAATGIGEAILAACGVTTALNPVGIGILATAAFSGGLYNVLRKKD